jgi:hypothetical protein
MATFRTANDIILSYIEYLRLVVPDLDTKPGTVARDVFIDAPSTQIADLYDQLKNISSLQSLFSTSGSDLVKLGSNFGLQKTQGSPATGVAVFTTNNLDLDILIPSATVVTARNGVTFRTTANAVMSSSSSNVYRATATRLRNDLELANITDTFAIEVNCEALVAGTSGNIGRFSLLSQNVAGISNITNLSAFSGGTGVESDSEFRTRILSIFAGSNTGTSLGYENVIKSSTDVEDAIVIVPGDPLLTRDGTEVTTDSSGNLAVSESGSGGKVDIYILGESLESAIDSFIYNDQSGDDDPTDTSNDTILGQSGGDTTLDSSQRRVDLIASGVLPQQPVVGIVSVSGSVSGSNFVAQYTSSTGETKGNYYLSKDTGDLAGSPFGFDKLTWISDEIEMDNEDVTKGIFNGSDELTFPDVTEIRSIDREVLVINENSDTSSSSRSSLMLRHTPVKSVSRVINVTTGERYTVSNQNPDGTAGQNNTTGRILISGSTLPVANDTLQVDYTWIKEFDSILDFDDLKHRNKFRTAQDSVDWSFGNLIREEESVVVKDDVTYTVEVTDPISRIISVCDFETEDVTVSNNIITLSEVVTNIVDITRASDGAEIFNTDLYNGILSGTTSVILPTDTLAIDEDTVTARFNATDMYVSDAYGSGTFTDSTITLPADANDGYALVTYIANVQNLIPSTDLSALPIFDDDNNFVISNETSGYQPTSNLIESSANIQNLRRAASNIRVSLSSIVSNGNIVLTGTTFNKVEDVLVTVISGNGYDINLSAAVIADLGVSAVPSSVRVARVEKVESVTLNSSNLVTSVDNTYDIVNYRIRDNSYDLDKSIVDSSLAYTTISLPRTSGNTTELLTTGDILRVTFYYVDTDDSERIFFSRSGTQISEKVFSHISRVYVSSGFTNVAGAIIGEISVNNFNQPIGNTTYSANYNYTAPKENERITATFNVNDLIRTSTLAVEDVRPITGDVLVKAAIAKDVDVTIYVVILEEFEDSELTVLQDANDSVTTFLNSDSLGTTIDASDIVNNLYTVNGIDRVQIINFSSGSSGNKLSISAEKNEYLRAGTVSISATTR